MTGTYDEIPPRERPNRHRPWSPEELAALQVETDDGMKPLSWLGWKRIADSHGRSVNAVQQRARILKGDT